MGREDHPRKCSRQPRCPRRRCTWCCRTGAQGPGTSGQTPAAPPAISHPPHRALTLLLLSRAALLASRPPWGAAVQPNMSEAGALHLPSTGAAPGWCTCGRGCQRCGPVQNQQASVRLHRGCRSNLSEVTAIPCAPSSRGNAHVLPACGSTAGSAISAIPAGSAISAIRGIRGG